MKDNFKINKTLIWDYDFKDKFDTEEFKRLYIGCVLTRGAEKDIHQVGFRIIKQYLPFLNLPGRIKKFWEWYFNYAGSDRISGKAA